MILWLVIAVFILFGIFMNIAYYKLLEMKKKYIAGWFMFFPYIVAFIYFFHEFYMLIKEQKPIKCYKACLKGKGNLCCFYCSEKGNCDNECDITEKWNTINEIKKECKYYFEEKENIDVNHN